MEMSVAPGRHLGTGHRASARFARLASRRPVLVLLAWFFTVGQLVAFVPRIAEHLGAPAPPTEQFIIASTWVGLLLPVLVLTWATDGRDGVSRLVARTVRWRVPAGWYAVPLLAVPGGIVGLQGADQGLPTLAAGQAAVDVLTHFLVPLLVVLVTVNLAEEVVWTGFVQTRLRAAGRSPLGAASIVAPLFALQHVSLLAGGPGEVAALLVLLAGLALPFRLLLGWLLDRTGSLLVVGLVHASGNAAALGSLGVVGLVPAWFGQDGQSLLVLAALGLVVAPAALRHNTVPTMVQRSSASVKP